MMRTAWLAASVLLVAAALLVSAEGVGVGGVVRSSDGLPIPGATVLIAGTSHRTTTDEKGRWSIGGLEAGFQVTVVALAEGFADASRRLVTGAVSVLDFELELARLAESVVVAAEVPLMSASEGISGVRLAPEQVATLPSLGEKDLFRAFQLLPGVQSTETSSGLYVRGGKPDQNLVTYDGFTVYHVDHLFGYFSAFNMEAVEEARLHKGAIDARYGGRLSSVIDIKGRVAGTDGPHFRAGASLLSVNGLAEVPLAGKGSLLLAGRRSFQSSLYDKILGQVDTTPTARAGFPGGGPGGGPAGGTAFFQTQPRSHFYDLNGKLSYRFSEETRLTGSFFLGRDDVDNSRSLELPENLIQVLAERGFQVDSSLGLTDLNVIDNLGSSLSLSHRWSARARSVATLGFSRFENGRDRSGGASGAGFGPPPESIDADVPLRPLGATGSGEHNRLSDLTFRLDNSIDLGSSNQLELGLQVTSNDVGYAFDVEQQTEDETGATRVQAGGILDLNGWGRQLSGYLQDRWTLFRHATLTAGLRLTDFDATSATYLEPRVALSVNLTDRLRLKGAWERHHQFLSKITREDVLQGDSSFWVLSDDALVPVPSARQVMAGLSYETADLLFDAEFYERRLEDLTEFAPRFLLLPDQSQQAFGDYFYEGRGVARGVELLLQKKFGAQTGWVSYTLSRVEHDFPDLATEPYPASHDRTHELKLVDTLRLDDLRIAATFVYSTGAPYTEPAGIEETQLPSGFTVQQVIAGQKNAARLPGYHRLDLAANWEFELGRARGLLGVTLFNVYDRPNVWYREFQALDDELIQNDILLMGRTLNLSLGVRF